MRGRPHRRLVGLAAITAAAALVAAGCGDDAPAPPAPGSTVERTLVDPDGDGRLDPGPGEPLLDRTDLGPARPAGAPLATFAILTDVHLRDEESPARVPFLARYGDPFTSTFRPHEALIPHVLAAMVRSLNAQQPDAVFLPGDLIDTAQANEHRQLEEVLAGGRVNPDSGGRGYRGVQEAGNPDPLIYRPDVDAPRHPGLLDAAQRPFPSPGLRAPWHAVAGNHDVLLAGELPVDAEATAVATGRRLVTALDPRTRPGDLDRREAVDELLGAAGRSIDVPADPERRHLDGSPFEGDRAVAVGGVRAIVLDTTRPDRGSGRTTAAQRAFLDRELDGEGPAVVISHHPLDDRAWAVLDGRALAAFHGHTHRHAVAPRGRTWEIATAALADHPMQARMVAVRAGGVIETWTVDHDGAGLAGPARELAFLDARGGRPRGYAGDRRDRNVRLYPVAATG